MGRAFKGCCCGVALLAVLAAALLGWNSFHSLMPAIGNAVAVQGYANDYNKAISDYSKRLDEVRSDPRLKSALSAAQKHAEHIRQMKQIVDAQYQCEHALKGFKPPEELKKFNAAMQVYFQELSSKSQELEASVKHHDVPDLNVDLKKIDASAQNAAENVDKSLAQIPHYEQGKKQILDLWSQFKKKMDEAAPPISN